MAADILAELTTTKDNFLKALSVFSQAQFNTIPFEGS